MGELLGDAQGNVIGYIGSIGSNFHHEFRKHNTSAHPLIVKRTNVLPLKKNN